MIGGTAVDLYARLGRASIDFACCDTRFRIEVAGVGADEAARRARETARRLESRLNAFDEASAVATLEREGRVDDPHVAAVVRRGLTYRERTEGAFDITHGAVEQAIKSYVRDGGDRPVGAFADGGGGVRVDGSTVRADRPLDLNGLAKGYLVDRTSDALVGLGRRGFVDGGGDVAHPTGPIAVESPYGDETPLKVLDTDWNVASSAGYRRGRAGLDHIYDPVAGELGTSHDLVTVVAERDCAEADALATALAASPLEAALDLAEGWPRAEALVVHDGVFHRTANFDEHVARSDRSGASGGWRP